MIFRDFPFLLGSAFPAEGVVAGHSRLRVGLEVGEIVVDLVDEGMEETLALAGALVENMFVDGYFFIRGVAALLVVGVVFLFDFSVLY